MTGEQRIAFTKAQVQAETQQCPDYRVKARVFYEKKRSTWKGDKSAFKNQVAKGHLAVWDWLPILSSDGRGGSQSGPCDHLSLPCWGWHAAGKALLLGSCHPLFQNHSTPVICHRRLAQGPVRHPKGSFNRVSEIRKWRKQTVRAQNVRE